MEFGPDDLVMFGMYYLPSLAVAVATSLAMLAAIILGRRLHPKFAHWAALGVGSVSVPLVCWVVYVASTSGLTSTLILLDSESSGTAENAYANKFSMQVQTVDAAVRLAINKHQAPNVRFYASCLIADMLAAKDEATVSKVLEEVEGAPIIETQFFGGNRLTEAFYVPGHSQVHLPVRDIVDQRLHQLRQAVR